MSSTWDQEKIQSVIKPVVPYPGVKNAMLKTETVVTKNETKEIKVEESTNKMQTNNKLVQNGNTPSNSNNKVGTNTKEPEVKPKLTSTKLKIKSTITDGSLGAHVTNTQNF